MSLTNDDLLAISQLLDTKLDDKLEANLKPIREDIHTLKVDVQGLKEDVHYLKLTQENVVLPRLNTIETCYIDTYKRYRDYADKMDTAFQDIDVLKDVVSDHSRQLQMLA